MRWPHLDIHIYYNMSIKSIVLLALVAVSVYSKPLKATKITKAINCGLKEGTTKGEGDLKYENVLHHNYLGC